MCNLCPLYRWFCICCRWCRVTEVKNHFKKHNNFFFQLFLIMQSWRYLKKKPNPKTSWFWKGVGQNCLVWDTFVHFKGAFFCCTVPGVTVALVTAYPRKWWWDTGYANLHAPFRSVRHIFRLHLPVNDIMYPFLTSFLHMVKTRRALPFFWAANHFAKTFILLTRREP